MRHPKPGSGSWDALSGHGEATMNLPCVVSDSGSDCLSLSVVSESRGASSMAGFPIISIQILLRTSILIPTDVSGTTSLDNV